MAPKYTLVCCQQKRQIESTVERRLRKERERAMVVTLPSCAVPVSVTK